ncbi:MAG: sigma-70 family RNA polymerase sigma factor [Patescibacteria group bacterium]
MSIYTSAPSSDRGTCILVDSYSPDLIEVAVSSKGAALQPHQLAVAVALSSGTGYAAEVQASSLEEVEDMYWRTVCRTVEVVTKSTHEAYRREWLIAAPALWGIVPYLRSNGKQPAHYYTARNTGEPELAPARVKMLFEKLRQNLPGIFLSDAAEQEHEALSILPDEKPNDAALKNSIPQPLTMEFTEENKLRHVRISSGFGQSDFKVPVDALRSYFNKISQIVVLNAAQEVELAQRIEAGLAAEAKLAEMPPEAQFTTLEKTVLADDVRHKHKLYAERAELMKIMADGKFAKDLFIEANLRLVVSVAKQYTGHSMRFMDLIQEGNKGLILAVEKFDFMKGTKFSTHATWWIRQAITSAFAAKWRQAQREPHTDSLDRAAGKDRDTPLGDVIEDKSVPRPEDIMLDQIKHNRLRQAFEALKEIPDGERLAGVLLLRSKLTADGKPRTLREVGRVYGISEARVRQLEAEAKKHLRNLLT